MSGVALFAALGILAALATLAFGTVRGLAGRLEGAGAAAVARPSSDGLRTVARLCLGLSCIFALAALGELWLNLQGQERPPDLPRSSAWGALWVYVLALLAEWRLFGLAGAGRRAVAGWLLAGAGVLFLGIGLDAWASFHLPADAACVDGVLSIDATAPAVTALAALGLTLVPLSGVALRLAVPAAPPLSAAAASVAVAVWLQPVLPALGWLPLSLGAGAVLALLFVVSLFILGRASAQGPWAAAGGLSAYVGLSVGGCIVLGML